MNGIYTHVLVSKVHGNTVACIKGDWNDNQLDRMSSGRAPQLLTDYGLQSYHLHHPNGRVGADFFNFIPLTPKIHSFLHYGHTDAFRN